MTFLNVGGAFPNSPLTIVIYGDSLENFNFKPANYYKGKDICVTGKIKIYKGKPEIIVTKASEIKVK